MVDVEQGGVLGTYEELVVVAFVAVSGPHPRHLAVGAVEEHVLPLAQAGVLSLPPSEHGAAPVALQLEIHNVHRLARHGAEPDGLTGVVEYEAAVLPGTGLSGTVFRGDENIARGRIARLGDHLYYGRAQVGARAEGPRLARPRVRGCDPEELVRLAAHSAAQRDPHGGSGRCS